MMCSAQGVMAVGAGEVSEVKSRESRSRWWVGEGQSGAATPEAALSWFWLFGPKRPTESMKIDDANRIGVRLSAEQD